MGPAAGAQRTHRDPRGRRGFANRVPLLLSHSNTLATEEMAALRALVASYAALEGRETTEATDLVTYQRAHRLEPAEQERLVALHQSGLSVLKVARELGVHRDTVWRHLAKRGLVNRRKVKFSPEEDREIAERHAAGETMQALAQVYEVHPHTISAAVGRAEMRSRTTSGRLRLSGQPLDRRGSRDRG